MHVTPTVTPEVPPEQSFRIEGTQFEFGLIHEGGVLVAMQPTVTMEDGTQQSFDRTDLLQFDNLQYKIREIDQPKEPTEETPLPPTHWIEWKLRTVHLAGAALAKLALYEQQKLKEMVVRQPRIHVAKILVASVAARDLLPGVRLPSISDLFSQIRDENRKI